MNKAHSFSFMCPKELNMPSYIYEAKSINGNIIKGKLDAEDKNMVTTILRSKNYYPIKIDEEGKYQDLTFESFRKIPYKDFAMFCRQLYFTLSSGIPMLRAINIIKSQTENKKLKKILDEVYDELQKGKSLAEALKTKNEIPYILVAMIEVGESSGNLEGIMSDLAEYYEKQHKQRQKIKSITAYPKFLLCFAIVILTGLITFVIPKFVNDLLSGGGKLPLPTKIILNISNFLSNYMVIILCFIILIVLIKKLIINKNENYKYKRDKFKCNSIIIGDVHEKVITSRFARTFGTLVSGGMGIMQALEISTNALDNLYKKDLLIKSKDLIGKGNPIGESLEINKTFPLMLTQMVKVGEETGKLDDILRKTSEFYDNEADYALQKLTSLIEPILIIILAIVVGFVMFAMVLPMFEIVNTIR